MRLVVDFRFPERLGSDLVARVVVFAADLAEAAARAKTVLPAVKDRIVNSRGVVGLSDDDVVIEARFVDDVLEEMANEFRDLLDTTEGLRERDGG